MNSADPLLSVVVTSRNDNHGKNLLRRMQTFVNCFIGQCQRHQLHSELIIVEWNPPEDRWPLIEALRWPEQRDYCQVRIIQVPPELHHKHQHSEALPLFQMIGKNVGIRRAKGKYVLATNIDILINDALMEYMAAGKLEPNRVYRIDRHDAMEDVPVDGPVEEQLRYCDTHQLRVNFDWATYPLTPDGEYAVSPNDIVAKETGIVFGRGWFSPIKDNGEHFRWFGEQADIIVNRRPDHGKVLCLEMEPGPGAKDGVCIFCVQDAERNIVAKGSIRDRRRVFLKLPYDQDSEGPFRFTIKALNEGIPAPKTAYILNARVLGCYWADEQAQQTYKDGFESELIGQINDNDIATLESGIRLLEKWYHREKSDEGPFRWMYPGATISIEKQLAASQVLRMELESGPTLGFRPFTLHVYDRQRNLLASGPVRGRCKVYFRVPDFVRDREELQFTLDYESAYANGLSRDTYCRVLSIDWCDEAEFESVPAPDSKSRNFRAVYVPEGRKFRLYQNRAVYFSLCVLPRLAVNGLMRLLRIKPRKTEFPVGKRKFNCPVRLHTNACGDFTMMARENWFAINGNPELEIYSLHLDSLLCYQAHHAGFEEVILRDPMRIYHIEHSKGSGWTPEGEGALMKRLTDKGIPVLEYEQLMDWATEMRETNRPMAFSDENWGLGNHELPEFTLESPQVRAA